MESDIELLAQSSPLLIPLHQNTFELEVHSIETVTMATEQDQRMESSLENDVDPNERAHESLLHLNFDGSTHGELMPQQCIEPSLIVPIEEVLEKARSVFGNLIQLSVDSKGLVYHCDQYGSTLVIPEGAVQQTATVWFGSCFFSDKFKFGNYVPVTPIVWVYINQKLHKCAELYVTHDTDISSEADLCQFTILTADDNSHSGTFEFYQKQNSILQAHSGFEQVFKIQCSHFCSNCVAVHKRQYKAISKRYLIARAEKREKNSNYIIEFIFICQQQGCRKMIEGQCAKEGFMITSYKAVTFTGDGRVSLLFEPDTFIGWKRHYDHLESEYISAESIDYYKIMGCENVGEVTEDELERLDLLEDTLSYPPRFRIQFSREDVFASNQEVVITFNQVHPSVSSKILLESNGIVQTLSPPSSCSSASSNTCSIDSFSIENDPDLGDILHIITSENYLNNNWYAFGYYLKLDTGLLNEIETLCTSTIQCTRRTILHWRNKNKTGLNIPGYISWEPLAIALVKVGFPNLAHKIKDHFQAPPEPEFDPCFTTQGYNGIYCSLCDDYHLNFEELKQHVPSSLQFLIDGRTMIQIILNGVLLLKYCCQMLLELQE
ncbi:PREDICTED: uncharacterized protein LOC109583595 isoform X2 [Amphimedon queenslandica]|uniref:Death domain-containing protein n=1 Tax=Amphimedon queenslandica TaxID=400682 RepID=A0AAN0JC21_AMPQE|nr:PREDICTED: uncharacterized protein LOC109583595 isoform X2 [Amphimedon queenslandica]|eukprot:XP_019854570.1 PREDICTED: uncharacterized protein LOC109583595 isoform X2 [Amphimedon queenslandica]